MRKIIHSKFEINLSNLRLTDTQENSMFTDGFFVKTTFPFEIILTDEIEQQFDFISDFNTSVDTIYDVTYVHNAKQEKAKLEITQIIGEKMSAVLQYGFDEYPSFSKKLSELPLDNFNLPAGTDIYQHANTIVGQTWPAVNYNFPQIHTDKYEGNDSISNFEKIINKRVNGLFVQNFSTLNNNVVPTDYTEYDKNIMQPLPYALHILKQGFLDGGYTLAGNILNDELLKKATIFGDVDYFKKGGNEVVQEFSHKVKDYQIQGSLVNGKYLLQYTKNITLSKAGLYKITGAAYSYDDNLSDGIPNPSSPLFAYTNVYNTSPLGYLEAYPVDAFYDVDNTHINTFETYINVSGPVLNLYYQHFYFRSNNFVDDERIAGEFKIELILEDINGTFTSNIINENKIDLRKAVPDITFGEYVTFWKNYLNYDITGIEGNTIYMNKVEDKFNFPAAKDFSMFDQKKPVRKFKQGNSYLLKFQDIDSKEYEYKKVFQNKDGILYEGFTVSTEKTSTIEINGLPLPLLLRGVKTAHAFESNSSKVYVVPYNGLTNGLNLALPITDYLLENVHPLYWYLWFKFRINSDTFEWNFTSENEVFTNLIVKDVIHAYRNFHFIKSLTKTEIKPDLFEYELETEA